MPTVERELVGRQAELTRITEFLDPSRDTAQVLLLEGQPGIGKTSLWKAGRSASIGRGARILSSAPTQAEATLAYSVLGDLLHALPKAALVPLSAPLRTALDAALFEARAGDQPTDQLAVSTAVLRLLRHLAAEQPVLLAVDDLQWVDAPSLRVITFALRRLGDEPVKLLATHRVESASKSLRVIEGVFDYNQVLRVEVGPLSLQAIDDILLHRLDRPLVRPELDQVHAISGGNPFFALEIARFVVEHPAATRAGEPLRLPQSLLALALDRITRLPPSTRDLLVALAALARSDEAVLQRVRSDALIQLDPALDSQVVERSGGRLRFTHPLLASAAYQAADPSTRRRWHSRLAAVVREPGERARHLALSTLGPDSAVAAALERAAQAANTRGAPEAAAILAQQAAELTPVVLANDLERRRIMRAEYLLRAGDASGARALLNAVLEAAPADHRPASALRLMGSILFSTGDLAEAEGLLVEALRQTKDDLPGQALVERELIRAFNQRGQLETSLKHCDRLLEISTQSCDAPLADFARRLRAATGFHLGILARETRDHASAIADDQVAVALDDGPGGLHPLMDWGAILKWSDDFTRARRLFKRALTLTEGRDESLRAPILFHLAEMECWAGDWLLAAVYIDECDKAVIHSGQRSYARLPLSAKATLQSCRGELGAARTTAREALAISSEISDSHFRARALAILGAIELVAANPAEANRHFDEIRDCRLTSGNRYQGMLRTDGDEVETLLTLGRIDDATAVCDRLAADEQLFGNPWQSAIGARCRGLIASARGDLDRSLCEFGRALAAHAQLPMPLERGRTCLAYGSVLRRGKRKRAAREQLEASLEIFGQLGATLWSKRAQAELSRISPAPAGVSDLTPTEARVATLVAGGHTNKEVAAELSLSIKTVEANLSRVYDKLSVRSRSELARRWPDPG